MAIQLTREGLLAARSMAVGWTRELERLPTLAGRYPDYAQRMASTLDSISKDAVRLSWGTPGEVAAQAPKLLDYLNGVAFHAGTVAQDGAPKAANFAAARADARHANALVQQHLKQVAPHEGPTDFLW